MTDRAGGFRIAGLLRRQYQVSVRATGYAPRTAVVVTPGATRVELALDRGVTLDGRVVDGHGDPVANAQIELRTQDLDGRVEWWNGSAATFREALFDAQVRGPRPLFPAGELGVTRGRVPLVPIVPLAFGLEVESATTGYVTDGQGRFHLADVTPGVVVVSAGHPAYVRSESDPLAVRAGETSQVAIVLHTGGTLDGRAMTERGFPVGGLLIEVRSSREPTPRRVFTARDGTFRVPSVLGRVSLVALLGARVAARLEVEVTDDATVPVTLELPAGLRRISGRVMDARGFPVGGATVSLTTTDRAALGSGTTVSAPDGTFDTLVGGVGGLSVEIRHPEFAPRSARVEDPSRPMRFELSRGASIAMELHADGCTPGVPARVELRAPCGPFRATAVPGAELRIERVCAGRSQLIVEAEGCVRYTATVTVPSEGHLTLGRVELFAGGGAEGDIVDRFGSPIAGAIVGLEANASETAATAARSDRQGLFRVTALPLGDQRIVAWHPALGRSAPLDVRVIRGTVARGLRLRFEADQREATRATEVPSVGLGEGPGGVVEVRSIAAGSAAERAGLRPGDHVRSVGGVTVTDAADATRRMRGPLGDDVVLEVEREGHRRTVRFVREGR